MACAGCSSTTPTRTPSAPGVTARCTIRWRATTRCRCSRRWCTTAQTRPCPPRATAVGARWRSRLAWAERTRSSCSRTACHAFGSTGDDAFFAALARADRNEVRAFAAAEPGIVGRLASEQPETVATLAGAGNTPAVALALDLGFPLAADALSGSGLARAHRHGQAPARARGAGLRIPSSRWRSERSASRPSGPRTIRARSSMRSRPPARRPRGRARAPLTLAALLLVSFAVILGCAIAAGELLALAERPDGSTTFDSSITSWIVAHRTHGPDHARAHALDDRKPGGPDAGEPRRCRSVGRAPAIRVRRPAHRRVGRRDPPLHAHEGLFVDRQRPPMDIWLTNVGKTTSFPSGHATQSLGALPRACAGRRRVAIEAATTGHRGGARPSRRRWAGRGCTWGVHWTTDVLAGWLIAPLGSAASSGWPRRAAHVSTSPGARARSVRHRTRRRIRGVVRAHRERALE